MLCTICVTRPAVINRWCGCLVTCEHCLRGTIMTTGTVQCTHCRRLKPASPRQVMCFLNDVFYRRKRYQFSREVLDDHKFTVKLFDYMSDRGMDCRNIIRVVPEMERRPKFVLHVMKRKPELYRELPFTMRQIPDIAEAAIGADPNNVRYCDSPSFDLAIAVASKIGLRNLDIDTYSAEERLQLYDAAFRIPGNTDILRVQRPSRKHWMIAIKATPVLMCRIPRFDADNVNDILDVCKESKSFGIYENLSENLRSDALLTSHLMALQTELKTSFNFLRWMLCKPSRKFTAAALASCPQGLKYAGIGDYEYHDALSCVQRDGMMLKFVPSAFFTADMCAAAVAQNGLALRFCRHFRRNLDVQLAAIEQNKLAVEFADRTNPIIVHKAMPFYVEKYGVDEHVLMSDLVAAVKKDPNWLKYIPHEDHTPTLAALGNHKYVHPFYRDDEENDVLEESLLRKFIRITGLKVSVFDPRGDDDDIKLG